MDMKEEKEYPHPREGANPFSTLFFTYTFEMFKKGYRRTLEADDLYSPLRSDRSTLLGDRLESKWMKHLEYTKNHSKKPSLLRALVATFWPQYLYLGFLMILMDIVLKISQPIMLGYLLDYFRPDTKTTKEEAFWYAGAVVAINAGTALVTNQYITNALHYGMKVRASVCALIYRKTLKLSRSALGETASGKIVNLLSNDVSRFDLVSYLIHPMWVGPTTALIVTYLLWADAGWAGVVGIIPVFLIVPLQSYTGKLASIYRKQTAYKTDERIRLMDEIIGGIQVIKMYAWEKPFSKLIKIARKKELKIVTKISYVRGLFMTFNMFNTRVALFCTLLTIALSGKQITAATVFVFMSYFNVISQTMSTLFVRGIAELAEAFVSIRRLQDFLLHDEFYNASISTNNNDSKPNTNSALKLKGVATKWSPTATDNALKDININLPRGQLLGVIGPVGSGKSSLLQTILGEMDVTKGTIEINGPISYASQEPWVFASTVRQNIVFGQEYVKSKYSEVIKACALEKDFQQLPDGDMTIVGDRGASLSGGQKARINLARAVYRDAEIYLLDDPLSAVDIHVAKHLYKYCINGYLRNKSRILVTHQVYTLKDENNIVILNNGCIEAMGSGKMLSNTDIHYAKLLKQEPAPEQKVDEKDREKMIEAARMTRQISTRSHSSWSHSSTLSRSATSIVESLCQEEAIEENVLKAKDMQEGSSKGKVKGSLSLKYLLAGGNYLFVTLVLMLYLLAQMVASGSDFFVSYWTNVEEKRNAAFNEALNDTINNSFNDTLNITPNNTFSNIINDSTLNDLLNTTQTFERSIFDLPPTEELPSTELCLYVYAGLVVGLFFFAFSRSMLFYKLAMTSSQTLHDNLFHRVIYTDMGFFNTNPSGRILNRFSKDIGAIDELLPKAVLDAGQIILLMFGSVILVALVNPYFLIPVAVIGVIFWLLRVVYLKSSKNIKRLEGMMRSPVFSHLNATLQGLTTIRAYGAQEILKAEFDKHQDLHTSAWFMYITASSAFGFYLDTLCFLFTCLVTFSFLTFGDKLPGGEVGLAITQAAALTGLVQWGLRQSAEVANQLTAVERVLEYDNLPEEQRGNPKDPLAEWPQNGRIQFEKMGLRYAEDAPLVIKDLNIVIQPKEKVGIVGRTGAGKSSLISALFRLAPVEGMIEIDGIDTKNLSLQYLRSKISIIPQDPVLFSGTVRYNLDPFEEYHDRLLWKALEDVELKDATSTNNRLESNVMDRGSNFSVGQRQLICLARAIVRNNKILMLDEATANVDPQTDALIQKTIRQKFADCTVLTVAHRLNTIMDSDKVIVMENGMIVEANHPHLLMQNSKSMFYKMVARTGKVMCEQLKQVAKLSYENKHGVPE